MVRENLLKCPFKEQAVTLTQTIYGTKYSKMNQVKSFKGCLPQIPLGPFLNTLTHMFLQKDFQYHN